MRRALYGAALFVVATFTAALAQGGSPIRIGVLNDQSGVFADLAGPGSVTAAQMAAEDFGGQVLGRKVEILVADHQSKPDIGAAIARRWFDEEGVHAIVDVPVSSVGLAVQQIAKEKKRIVMFSGSTTSELVGKACSPTGFQWTLNTASEAKGIASSVAKTGVDTWFFITADYAFGRAMEADATAVINAHGGRVLGTVRHPINTNDFASYLLQAQASGAKVVALASGGSDLINLIKQAGEFGLSAGGQRPVSLQSFISDIHSLGLEKAQGLLLIAAFYWDLDDQTRAWSQRFAQRNGGQMPTMVQAGVYSAVSHYLKALKEAGTDDATTVASQMRQMRVNDFMTHNAQIRNDGWVMRDFYLFQVKSPAESKGAWDYYKKLEHIAAEEAAPPKADCQRQ
jgi:branched-chain amino acid transport system substrate-binding protein